MANENINIYEPRTMQKILSRTPPVRTFFLDTFFKNKKTFVTKTVDVDFKKGNRALAPFVHPKKGGKTVPNSGFQTETYKPPLVAPNKLTTADDLLDRRPGESIYSGRTPAHRAVEKIAEDFTELKEMIVRRLEWMAAQSILTGTIPIKGDGLDAVIDFQFTNKETITTAAKKWSAAATSTPYEDMKRWRKAVQKNGFVNTNIAVMADDVALALLKNEAFMKLCDTKAYDLAAIKPAVLPNGLTYYGTIRDLALDLYTYSEWYLDDWSDPASPVEMSMIPDGTIAMLSTAAQYSVYYGAVTLLDEASKKFYTVEGDMVPHEWIERNPDRRFIQIDSNPLTIPHEVNSWFVAKVL